MITFAGGKIDTGTLYHENMHQWWGDNVTEVGYNMTFYKEGLATLAEALYAARQAESERRRAGHHGRPGRLRGKPDQPIQQRSTKAPARFWDGGTLQSDPLHLFAGDSHL